MNRNETFSTLLRGAVHSSGELLCGIQNETWREPEHVSLPTLPAPEPVQQVEKPTPEVDVDIRRWLKVRDHGLGY